MYTWCLAAPLQQKFPAVPTEGSDRHAKLQRVREKGRQGEGKHTHTHIHTPNKSMHAHAFKRRRRKKLTLSLSNFHMQKHMHSIYSPPHHYRGPVVSTVWFRFEAKLQHHGRFRLFWPLFVCVLLFFDPWMKSHPGSFKYEITGQWLSLACLCLCSALWKTVFRAIASDMMAFEAISKLNDHKFNLSECISLLTVGLATQGTSTMIQNTLLP